MTSPRVLRIALLGAWQHHREGRFVDLVKARTPLVFPSTARRSAWRAMRSELGGQVELPRLEIRIAGYSWGAWSALQIAERLYAAPERLHPALRRETLELRLGLLDPVPTFRRPARLPESDRVRAWVIHQRNGCYKGCPGPSPWFAGVAVPGATNWDVTEAGRGGVHDGRVPPECAPDHIQMGYTGFGDFDLRIARVLDEGHVQLG
jgi:hypothetical protein